MLHYIQHEADGLLGQCRDQVIVPGLLPVNAMKPETALSQHKPAHRLIHPEGREPKAVEASRPGLVKVDEVLVFHEKGEV
jgi:hypothetical protein